MQAGPLAGFPLTDVRVTLLDGAYHDVDSSELAFKIAGIAAFKEAAKLAGPVLLEPVMKVLGIQSPWRSVRERKRFVLVCQAFC